MGKTCASSKFTVEKYELLVGEENIGSTGQEERLDENVDWIPLIRAGNLSATSTGEACSVCIKTYETISVDYIFTFNMR